jgi:hypothetical protein
MPVIIPLGAGQFTEVVVTGTFTGSGGEPASGTLTFTLTQAMTSGDVVAPPKPIVATLNEEGGFTVVLYANDDTATVPQGVRYGVTEEIVGAQPRDYYIRVSHTVSPADIAMLAPGETGWT